MIEVKIPANKKRSKKFLHLNSHIKWNRYDKIVKYQKSKKIWNKSQNLQEKKRKCENYCSDQVKHGNLVMFQYVWKIKNQQELEDITSHVHMRKTTHSDNAGISRLPQ